MSPTWRKATTGGGCRAWPWGIRPARWTTCEPALTFIPASPRVSLNSRRWESTPDLARGAKDALFPLTSETAEVLPRPHARLTHVARSSILIGVLFGLDKLLGLVRQVIIGRQFGVSRELDAFNAANNLPDLLFALITGGALAVAFIPVLFGGLGQGGR